MYEKIVKQQRKEIAKLTLEQQKQILDLYDDAIEDLSKEAAKSKDKSLQKRWQLDYIKELEKVRNQLEKEIGKQVVSSTKEAARIGAKAEQQVMGEMFKKAGIDVGPHFTEMFSQVQDNVVRDIVTGNLYKDNKTLSQRIWRTGGEFEKDIQYTINQAILQKKSAIELAKDLEKFVKEPAKRDTNWGKCYPRLRNRRVNYNAMRLARTSINHAYQTASIQSSNINPFVDGIEWRSALIHGRTCGLCIERHGQVFPKDDVPLDHPNGLCTMLPVIEKGLDQVAKELRDWVDGEDNPILDKWFDSYGEYFGKIIKGKTLKNKVVEKIEKKRYNSTKEAFKRVAYANIEKGFAKEIDAELLDIINKYPLDSKDMTVRALKEKGAFGYKRSGFNFKKKNGTLEWINEIVYSNFFQGDRFISTKYHEMNYKNRKSPLLKSKKIHLATISHEYGHAIDLYYLFEKESDLRDRIKRVDGSKVTWDINNEARDIVDIMFNSSKRLSVVLYKEMQKEYGLNDVEFREKVTEELGTYAASEPAEFLAEGFANMNCLEEEQKSDFLKLFEEKFNREFDKVLRGVE